MWEPAGRQGLGKADSATRNGGHTGIGEIGGTRQSVNSQSAGTEHRLPQIRTA